MISIAALHSAMRCFHLRLLVSSVCMLSTSSSNRYLAHGLLLPLRNIVNGSISSKMAASSNSSRSTQRALPTVAQLLDRDGKRIPRASLSSFLITSAIVPVWAVTILPLSLAYQAGAATFRAIANDSTSNMSANDRSASTLLDSGYVVDPSQIVERSQRNYDIVVLGATGFTGYLAARHLASTYGAPSRTSAVQWAIAGRSKDKLEMVKQRLADELGNEELLKVDIIECDTSVASTLPKLVQQTRVVATTAGPYTLYGSSVVEFCAKFGTHYVDITGEVDWVKAMLCQWQETAQKTGSRIIPFCGHDSIPWDISYLKLQEVLRTQCDDKLKKVIFWNLGRNEAPGGTFATIINGLTGNSIKPPKMDFDPFLRLSDGSKSAYVCKADLPSFPFIAKNSNVGLPSSRSKPWASPFLMAAVNSQVVRWSHALLGHGSRLASYREASLDPDFKTAFVNYMSLLMAGSMLFNPISLSLVQKRMVPKPGEGPSMESMEKKSEYN